MILFITFVIVVLILVSIYYFKKKNDEANLEELYLLKKQFINQGYDVTDEKRFYGNRKSFLVDDNKRKFAIADIEKNEVRTFNFSDFVDCYFNENDKIITHSHSNRKVDGAIAFKGFVGVKTTKTTTYNSEQVCKNLVMTVKIKGCLLEVDLVPFQCSKDSFIYKKAMSEVEMYRPPKVRPKI